MDYGTDFCNDGIGACRAIGVAYGMEQWRRAGAEDLGLSIINAGGRNEIMAQYTCLFLAMAAVCAAALVGAVPRQAALIVLAVIFGGLLVGRLVSLPLNGGIAGYSRTIVSLYAIDAVGLALTAAALVLNNHA